MLKKTLVTLFMLAGFIASAQINTSLPYPDMIPESDTQNEEITDVCIKVKQAQAEKLITFEYASHGASWELEIRDSKGMLLLKRTPIHAENLLVSSSGFSTGTYLCTLYTRNSIITKKMILD